ncbi:MecA protein [Gordoniibacillus kamchatkensis]|uniref:MecA protein n=1 Tax=Gordoniibacillus kamchatkensis TaxID=1590651 RepID=A0ABR5AGG6_9BACL|nr:MecA protein [Paenibacillus sp. VKM B-2647]
MLLTIGSLAAACDKEKKKTPEQQFQAYADAWQAGRYDAMYELLSPDSQKKISKDDFVKKYTSIQQGIEMQNLAVRPEPAASSPAAPAQSNKVELRYRVSMTTFAGDIEYGHHAEMVRDSNADWKVDWNPSLIFPSMRDGDKVAAQVVKAPRGQIFDRNGDGLAVNGKVTVVGLVPDQLGEKAEETKQVVARQLHIAVDDINNKLKAPWVKPGVFVPIATADDRMRITLQGLDGVSFQQKSARTYPLGEAAAHLTGYVQTISAEQLGKLQDKGYNADDKIGKAGLEQIFEDTLRGKDGGKIAVTDDKGAVREILAQRDPIPGQDVKITVDASLQRAIYEQYNGDAGAAAAVQPQTGEILALVSSPAYDPNAFVAGVPAEQWNSWNNDPKLPLLNRFTKLYAPGSIFKTVTAAVGLEAKVTKPDRIRQIQGLHWTKDASWGNYYVTRDRDVPSENLRDAIVYSDNIFLAQEALEMGKDTFTQGALAFGFGEALPIPYPFPVASLANKGIAGDIQLADSAYGQGEVQMSPLHVALAYTPFVNKGDLMKPVLLKDEASGQGTPWKKSVVGADVAETIRQDLIEAVRDPNGFAYGANLPGMTVAGKTGTAELKQKKGEDGKENGWFAAFNADKPQLLLTMMIEDVKGRGGSSYVVAKAKKMMSRFGKQSW